jgi:hypothetical protein
MLPPSVDDQRLTLTESQITCLVLSSLWASYAIMVARASLGKVFAISKAELICAVVE